MLLGGEPVETTIDVDTDDYVESGAYLDLTRRPVNQRFTGCGCLTCESDQ